MNLLNQLILLTRTIIILTSVLSSATASSTLDSSSTTTNTTTTTMSSAASKYYISVTGLQVKSIWHQLAFARHAMPTLPQAQQSPGNIQAMATYRNGIHHTLSVWKDRKSMTRYMVKGAHAQAMKAADTMSAPGGIRVYGYYSDTIPSLEDALALWDVNGTRHGKLVPNHDRTPSSSSQATTTNTTSSSSGSGGSKTTNTFPRTAAPAVTITLGIAAVLIFLTGLQQKQDAFLVGSSS